MGIHNYHKETNMSSIATSVAPAAATWGTMNGASKALYVGRLCIMLCTFGFIFGGVLVEGMKYDKLPQH